MKIHQNWLVWRILLIKKKGCHFTTYFSKGNFRRKKNVHFWIRTTLTKWTFFSIGPIWMIFMGGTVNTCYFLDFEKVLQIKGKKGLYAYFGTLADFVTLDTKKPRYQNMHITLFLQKIFEI